MPAIVEINNLSKSIGELELFADLNFNINEGQKVALIANNGEGKTSLLSILTGHDSHDSGSIKFLPGKTVGYLPQNPDIDLKASIIDNIFSSSSPNLRLIKEYESALIKADESALNELLVKMDNAKLWDYETRIKQILSELGIHNLEQNTGELSGGQKKRIALAKALIEEPDFLILDEPTNHLDIKAIEWLEKYLERQKNTVLMVTHDRFFLDRVCNIILELDNKSIYKYQGNYSYFLRKREERLEQMAAETEKARNLLRTEEDWMRRMPKARGTKAKYRIDNYYNLKDKAAGRLQDKKVEINVDENRLGSKILVAKNLNFLWNNEYYLKDFSYTFSRFEKIGILGENGSGKSTFLNLLTQKLTPESGSIETGVTIKFGYYRQDGMDFDPQMKVIDAVTKIAETIRLSDGNSITAPQFLNHFLFPHKRQNDYIYKLSGGEKRRLYLCTVLMQNPNFLILDEPTNDLDIATLHVLEEYLQAFNGCVLVVSHDRYFMDKVVDHIFVFKGNGVIKDFPGNYSAFFEKSKLEQQEKTKAAKSSPKKEKPRTPSNKMSYKEKRELELLEEELPLLEEKKKELEEELNSGKLDHVQLQEVAAQLGKLIESIEVKSDRWIELSDLQ